MRIAVVERLTEKGLLEHATVLDEADVCIPLFVASSAAANQAAKDPRWWFADLRLFEDTLAGHARWVDRLVGEQVAGESGLLAQHSNLVAYGLEVRLRASVLADGFIRYLSEHHRCALTDTDIVVIGDDPYLLNTFSGQSSGSKVRYGSVTRKAISPIGRLTAGIRERAAASSLIRRSLTITRWRSPAVGGSERSPSDASRPREAALFVQNYYQLGLFRPTLEKLASQGMRVSLFGYTQGRDGWGEVEYFRKAVRDAGGPARVAAEVPEWHLPDHLLRDSPVSEKWLRRALNASWLTGVEQIELHQSLLAERRPDVVLSYTIDSVALGLQAAAESLDIPSVFVNHGPQASVSSSWFFPWTASAMAGQPCVEANRVGPGGRGTTGLVAIGYPPFDGLLRRSLEVDRQPDILDEIDRSPARPYIVLVFAEYGNVFWVHALQRRMLSMIAEALPEDCFLICKLHPAGSDERGACEEILGSLLPLEAFAVIDERQYSTPDLLAGCHLAVASERCMALTDSIFLGRPCIGIRFPEIPQGSNDLKHPARGPEFAKCCRIVEDATELSEAINVLTRDAVERDKLLRNRKRYIEQFYVDSDAGASTRLAALVAHLAACGDVAEFQPPTERSLL